MYTAMSSIQKSSKFVEFTKRARHCMSCFYKSKDGDCQSCSVAGFWLDKALSIVAEQEENNNEPERRDIETPF